MFQLQIESSGFINFKSLLQASLMLHDDFLLQFLTDLKYNLERVQVCFGEIESWLMGTISNHSWKVHLESSRTLKELK